MQLDLFRVKVFRRSEQQSLFAEAVVPPAILRAALEERPTSKRYRGATWHVGNVEPVGTSGFYFRLGRESRSTVPLLDASGNFIESEVEHAPYTHGLLDPALGLCGLARNAGLAVTTSTMANRLAAVLAQSRAVRDREAAVAVGPISNPETFITLLTQAFAIRSFSFTFQRRNPFDANVDFVQPLERLVESTNGGKGQTTIRGRDLLAAPLEEVTRSVAATGDEAKARLLMTADSKPEVRHLRGDTASISSDTLDAASDREKALVGMRAAHARVRGTGDSPA